jgi:hypothetical protein
VKSTWSDGVLESPHFGIWIADFGKFNDTAESQRGQNKLIVAINALSKRILGTAIAVLSIKRVATVVFYFLKP